MEAHTSTPPMRAVVMPGDGRVVIEERARPTPGPLGAVIRATIQSFCSGEIMRLYESWTRIEGYSDGAGASEHTVSEQMIVGHEAIGIVEEVGELVERFHPGDRVALSATSACGRCENCQRGAWSQCHGIFGSFRYGVTDDGNMSEYFLAPDADFTLAVIPENVTDEQAVLVPDTMSTGFSAAERGSIPLGGTVAVFGQGHIGLSAMAAARLLGAGRIIAVKASPRRAELSRKLGADIVLAASECDPVEAIKELTNGVGVDTCITATGRAQTIEQGVAVTRPAGVISDINAYSHYHTEDSEEKTDHIRIPLLEWGSGCADKRLVSTLCPPSGERISRFLRLIQNGRVDLTPMITHRYHGFEEIPAAFEAAVSDKDFLKAVITL
jgi:threonine dehydrogenase-like Zn-dependent dehydrogenase